MEKEKLKSNVHRSYIRRTEDDKKRFMSNSRRAFLLLGSRRNDQKQAKCS